MKPSILFPLFLSIFFLLQSCGSNEAAKGGGSVVGNGRKEFSSHVMGIAFGYPQDWLLTGDSNSTSISLASPPGGSRSSIIRFSLKPTLEGQRFEKLEDLKSFLSSRWGSQKWQDIGFSSGQSGFYSVVRTAEGVEEGTYYLLDQNYNVLSIYYSSPFNLGDYEVIKAIVNSMAIDRTVPVFERAYFIPSIAEPGQTVKLVVEAWDEISGIDPASFYKQTLWWDNPPLMGYLATHDGSYTGLHRAFPIIHPWVQESLTRFSYEFKIPEGAPAGKISAPFLRLADKKGNTVEFDLDDGTSYLREYHSYLRGEARISSHQGAVARPELTVTRKNAHKPADSQAPQLVRAWFEKTLVTRADPSQKFYFEVKEDSPLFPIAGLELIFVDTGSELGFVEHEIVISHERENIYSIKIDLSKFFNYSPTGIMRNVTLSSLDIADDMGNLLVSSNPGPDATFMVAF